MTLLDLLKSIGIFVLGMVCGAAFILLAITTIRSASAAELTIEEQYEIHTQYLAATDAALEELNHCAAYYLMIPFMTEGKDPKASKLFSDRSKSLGHTLGVLIYHSEYYFPHIYGLDTNFEKVLKLSNTWAGEISQNPMRYIELSTVWLEKCETIAKRAKTYFTDWVKQYPIIQDDWPIYPGREGPPTDWVSPSMKRIQKEMTGEN
jgi:hypothetical protein